MVRATLEYRTYRIDDSSNLYEGKVRYTISRWQCYIQVQLSGIFFDVKDPIYILKFPQSYQMASIASGIRKNAANSPLQYILNDESHESLKANINAVLRRHRESRTHRHHLDSIMTSPEAVK